MNKITLNKINKLTGYNIGFIHTNKGRFSKHYGLVYYNKKPFRHKWTEDGIKYPFCLKCGASDKTGYWCKVPTNKFIEHDFQKVKLKSDWATVELCLCLKCGLLKCYEYTYYARNSFGNIIVCSQLCVDCIGKKPRSCVISNDDFLVKDIIL